MEVVLFLRWQLNFRVLLWILYPVNWWSIKDLKIWFAPSNPLIRDPELSTFGLSVMLLLLLFIDESSSGFLGETEEGARIQSTLVPHCTWVVCRLALGKWGSTRANIMLATCMSTTCLSAHIRKKSENTIYSYPVKEDIRQVNFTRRCSSDTRFHSVAMSD